MNYLTIEKFQPCSRLKIIRRVLLFFIILVVPFTITMAWVFYDLTSFDLSSKTQANKEVIAMRD